MADMTQTQSQGYFTSNGKSTTIKLASGVDWLQIWNITNSKNNSVTSAIPVGWYWQNGFPAGAGISYWKSNAAAASQLQQYNTTNGFTLINGYSPNYSTPSAITSTSNAATPVYTVGSTTGISVGSVVRIYGTSQMTVNGFDVQVGAFSPSASFTSAVAFATALPASTGGFYSIVNPQQPWYPARRIIANISQAASAVVTTTVQHNYVVGQEVTFRIKKPFGMVQLDGLTGSITAVTQFTFTVNIDTTAFTAFTWATFTKAVTLPQVLPVGEDTAVALVQSPPLYEFSDATINNAYIGIQFPGGAEADTAGPAGVANDVIYWRAGVSFQNDSTGSLIIQ